MFDSAIQYLVGFLALHRTTPSVLFLLVTTSRRTFKSMWKQIKLKALKEALISTVDSDDEDSESKKSGSYDYTLDFESEAVQKAILSSTLSFRKKSFTFADEYLSQPVLINYLMADPKSVCDYFIEKAVRSCLINKEGFPVKSEKNGYELLPIFSCARQCALIVLIWY
jgi:hypothetical protein